MDKTILNMQIVQAMLGVSLMLMIVFSDAFTKLIAVTFCVFVWVMTLLYLKNNIYLLYKTLKTEGLKRGTIVRNIFWMACGIFSLGFVAYFRLYDFWNC